MESGEWRVDASTAPCLGVLLEHAGAELPRHHPLLAVALALALRRLDDVLIATNLENLTQVQILDAHRQVNGERITLGCLLLLLLPAEAAKQSRPRVTLVRLLAPRKRPLHFTEL